MATVVHLDGGMVVERTASHGEHYIPLHATDLIHFLAQHPALPPEQRSHFRQFAALILSVLHHLYRQRHERLTYVYAPLDPDRDRFLATVPTQQRRPVLEDDLVERAQDTLRRANYHRLSPEKIESAMHAASQWGVRIRVDFQALQRLEIYARGHVIGRRKLRSWKTLYREKEIEVPLYQRVAVLFQTRPEHNHEQFDHRCIYLRLFKNVPEQDVDMMLPASGIQMTWLDHSKIVVPSLYAAGMTLYRFLRNVFLLAVFGVFKTVAVAVLVIFAIGFGIKSMFTYRTNTQRRYMLNVAQSLYYQSLDTNAGVLLRLLEEGEQQEAMEAILAYFTAAYLSDSHSALTLTEIDHRAEKLIEEFTGTAVNFDVEQSVLLLNRLGILSAAGNTWQAVPADIACNRLDQTWDRWFDA